MATIFKSLPSVRIFAMSAFCAVLVLTVGADDIAVKPCPGSPDEGEECMLTCPWPIVSNQHNKTWNYSWFAETKNGKTLESFIRDSRGKSIFMYDVTPEKNSGKYTCSAFDGNITKNHSWYLTVRAGGETPDTGSSGQFFTYPIPGQMVHIDQYGQDTNLSCTLNDANLRSYYREWRLNGVAVPDDRHTVYKNTESEMYLTIHNVSASDFGNYTCVVLGAKNITSAAIQLGLRDPVPDTSPVMSKTTIILISAGGGSGLVIIVVLVALAAAYRRKKAGYDDLPWEEPDMSRYEVPQCKIEYDVFISYSSDDLTWVKNSLFRKLQENNFEVCVDFKDFLPGANICDNIIESLYKSRKTVIVMSNNFLKSEWGRFELQQALMRGISYREDVVILIKLDNCKVPAQLMGKTYLDFSDEKVQPHFWKRLFEAVKGKDNERPPGQLNQHENIEGVVAGQDNNIPVEINRDACNNYDFVHDINEENENQEDTEFKGLRGLIQKIKRSLKGAQNNFEDEVLV